MMSVSVYSEYQCVSYYTCLLSQYGDSALMRVATLGRTEVVKKLIDAGVNLNLQNKVQTLSIGSIVFLYCRPDSLVPSPTPTMHVLLYATFDPMA